MSLTLVVGCGNTLRGDDAAGAVLVRQVAAWRLPGVIAKEVHQLLPELAEEFARAERVIVIDASADAQAAPVELRAVEPSREPPALGHVGDVSWLLRIAQELFGRAPPCWVVAVRGEQFELGDRLSRAMETAIDEAALVLRGLLTATRTL